MSSRSAGGPGPRLKVASWEESGSEKDSSFITVTAHSQLDQLETALTDLKGKLHPTFVHTSCASRDLRGGEGQRRLARA